MLNLAETFPRELDRHLATGPSILVQPMGTLEWHSHHLPLGLDGIVAQEAARAIAERVNGVLAPVSWWAVGGVPFPHTLKLPLALVEPLFEELYVQFGNMGFDLVLAFAGHFGLEQTLGMKRAAIAAMVRTNAFVLPLTEYDLVTDIYSGDHAAVGETSLLMSVRPELVRLGAVQASEELPGIIGPDPRGRATAQLGASIVEAIATRSADLTRRLISGADERMQYAQVLELSVEVLELIADLRQTAGKAKVAPIGTPEWLLHCAALRRGDYAGAQTHLRAKLADPFA